jgi:hypothetical protein
MTPPCTPTTATDKPADNPLDRLLSAAKDTDDVLVRAWLLKLLDGDEPAQTTN